MAYIPVSNTAQVELLYSFDVQPIETVLHYIGVTGLDSTKLTNLANSIITYWKASLVSHFVSTVQLQNVKVTDLTTQTGPTVTVPVTSGNVGTRAGAQMPNNVAWCFTKRTAQRGRSFRGRLYHFGMSEADVTGNVFSATEGNSLLSAYGGLLGVTNTDGTWTMAVVSRYSGNQPRITGIATPVIALTTDGVVDSQRRRLPGRGQ